MNHKNTSNPQHEDSVVEVKIQDEQKHQLIPFSVVQNYSIACTVRLQNNGLQLNYAISGDISNIELPEVSDSTERKIGLWERTCFELFIKRRNKLEYFEFNFSPAGDWNCFHFSSPNDELVEYPGIKSVPMTSQIEKQDFPQEYHLTSLISLESLGRYFYKAGDMQINLAAVILEPKKGLRTYWALDHKNNKPNFHNPNTFIMNL